MSTPDPVLERLRAADPAPEGAALPEAIWTASALLEEIDVRSAAPADPLASSRRFGPGLLAAAAAFAIVLIVGIALLLTLRSSGDPPPVDEPTTTTTTEVVTTTTSPAPVTTVVGLVTGPIQDPLDGGNLFAEAFTSRDLDALSALFAGDALLSVLGTDTGGLEAYTSFLWQMNGAKEISGCVLRSQGSRGTLVSCDQVFTTDVFRAADIEWSGNFTYIVADGFIVNLTDSFLAPSDFELWEDLQGGFERYLLANHPEAHAQTIRGDEQIFSAEAAQVYLDYYEEYLASRG